MSKLDSIEVEGLVTYVLPNTKFKVKLDNGKIVNAYLAGSLRKNFIKVLQGDRVRLELSLYDLGMGRITFRLK